MKEDEEEEVEVEEGGSIHCLEGQFSEEAESGGDGGGVAVDEGEDELITTMPFWMLVLGCAIVRD